VPKSSTATCIPLSLRVNRIVAVNSARLMSALSVSSNSRYLGSKPVSSRIAKISLIEFSFSNCFAETFTARLITGRPTSTHLRNGPEKANYPVLRPETAAKAQRSSMPGDLAAAPKGSTVIGVEIRLPSPLPISSRRTFGSATHGRASNAGFAKR
jgi:hypothetical protein